MQIALFHNLTSGGSKREAYEFARRFTAEGHEVDIYAPTSSDEDFLSLRGVARHYYAYELKLGEPLPLRLPGLRRYLDCMTTLGSLRRIRALARTMARDIDRRGYDFVFLHHDRIVQSPYLLRELRTPSVYYCAEPMRIFYEPEIPRPYAEARDWRDRLQRFWYAPGEKLLKRYLQREDFRNVQCATRLVTNSFFSVEAIYRAYGLRARVSYLGVDAEKFAPLPGVEKKPFVLSVGALSPLKGFDFLIEAIGKIPAGIRPHLLIIANTDSPGERHHLESLAERCGVRMELRVNVTDAELVRAYNQARALVYAPVLEPFGFSPLEAMACGLPVVAVKEGGVRESVCEGETGLLVPRDPEKFAAALEQVLKDENFSRRLGEAGRKRVMEFWTWKKAHERLLENVAGIGKGSDG